MFRQYFRELAVDSTYGALAATAGAGIAVLGFGAPVAAAGFASASLCAAAPYVSANIIRALTYGRDALQRPLNFVGNLKSYIGGSVVAVAGGLIYAGTGADDLFATKVSDPTARAATVAAAALFAAHTFAFASRAGLFGCSSRRAASVAASSGDDYKPLEGVAVTPATLKR